MAAGSRPSRPLTRAAWLAALLTVAIATGVRITAQATPPLQAVSPFDMVGFIQKATLDDPGDPLSGGTMTVNGHVITVPRFTILQMPAFALSWQEVFALAPLPYGLSGNGQSGLALTDSPTPLTTYEVHVQGNRVVDASGDRYIAGLIFISQQSLNVGQGYVNYIDYARAEMRVGGTPGDPTTGARVRINDPLAKFSRGDSPDRRFTIDEDNPTVRAETGYPLCLPRTNPFGAPGTAGSGDDPYCPQRNRPRTNPPVYDTVVGGNPLWFTPNNAFGPDSMLPAPFEVGDYIQYSGTMVYDGGGTTAPTTAAPVGGLARPDDAYISAHTIGANLGFYTQPGTRPVYVAIDVSLMGTGGLNTTISPQEATLRTRVEGFTTDPFGGSFTGAIVGGGGGGKTAAVGTAIDIFAMDYDCSGTETDRLWISGVAADPGISFGGAKAGRWRFRPTGGIFLPPPRNLRAAMSDGRRLVTANLPPRPGDATLTPQGLDTGQYNAPIFTYIFPENLVIGGPTIPANFADFPFLANGTGPYYGALGGTTAVGSLQQLAPWPGSPAPAVSCMSGSPVLQNAPEVLIAATPSFVNAGGQVTLTATATDLNLPPLAISSITWTGPSGITLSPSAASNPVSFTAPNVTVQTRYTFTATATNSAGLSSSATVSVTVNPAPILTAGAPSLAVTAFAGAATTAPGGGLLLTPPYTVSFGAFGIQLVAKTTANASITWVKPAALPNSTAISYSGPTSQTSNQANTTTSWLTFNAQWFSTLTGGQGLLPGNAPVPLTFTITAKDKKTGATQTQSVTVTVIPPPDTLTPIVTYVTGTAATGGGKASKMQVTVTTNAQLTVDPNTLSLLSPTFTLSFVVSDPNDPRFGQTVVWNSFALVLNVPTATVLGFPMPDSVTITSSAGGSVTVPSASFRLR